MTIAVLGGVLLAALFAGYMPAESARVEALTRLAKATKRAELGASLAGLKNERELYNKRVPKGANLTEWSEYLHGGATSIDVRMIFMEPKPAMKLGPCTALSWTIELEGSFDQLSEYVHWLENGERLMRIDRMVFDLSGKRLTLAMVVRGLVRS